jgi:nucleoside-diphosphate-sugar epimerase
MRRVLVWRAAAIAHSSSGRNVVSHVCGRQSSPVAAALAETPRGGPVIPHRPHAESRAPSPTSQRGKLRAEMEQQIRAAGIRYAMVRLPEFYGPSVVSLTARVFRAALADRRALWPGPLEVAIELVYMPDAARVLVEVAIAADCDAAVFHLPGARTTPRQFVGLVYRAAGRKPRVFGVPRWLLSAGAVFDATARGAADIGHLWTHPILLDGTNYTARFGAIPQTPLADAIAMTLAWHRAHPELRLQA